MRGESSRRDHGPPARVYGTKEGASFQIIVLGSSGGPREDTITGLLVRSTASEWRKGSVIAVDAGAGLAKIIRLLEQEHGLPWNSDTIPAKDYSQILTDGPFAGIKCPGISAKANALYIFRELLHSFLITHPHLDHISAMGINTPALEYGREAKAIVALPSTIDAIKNHIFNDAIWPNLSDESNGVGFVTYRRLIEGGNPRFGSGEGRGYVNVCDGLATKCWSLTHGRCRRHSHGLGPQRDGSFGFGADGYNFSSRRISQVSDGYMNAGSASHHSHPPNLAAIQSGYPKTPSGHPDGTNDPTAHFQPVDSSAFFIRNDTNGDEVIIFGDLEPDSVSMHPRNHLVWEDAAPKVAGGTLRAIFIECSFDDSTRDQDLYGHLTPRHLVAELVVLATKVTAFRKAGREGCLNLIQPPSPSTLKKKRKRTSSDLAGSPRPITPNSKIPLPNGTSPSSILKGSDTISPHTRRSARTVQLDGVAKENHTTPNGRTDHADTTLQKATSPRPLEISQLPSSIPSGPPPLAGLTIHVIHVKDTLADGPPPGEVILKQLRERGQEAGLGCDFDVTSDGESIWV